MLKNSSTKIKIRFLRYEQSSQCKSMRDSSVSYASAVGKVDGWILSYRSCFSVERLIMWVLVNLTVKYLTIVALILDHLILGFVLIKIHTSNLLIPLAKQFPWCNCSVWARYTQVPSLCACVWRWSKFL